MTRRYRRELQRVRAVFVGLLVMLTLVGVGALAADRPFAFLFAATLGLLDCRVLAEVRFELTEGDRSWT